MITAMIFDLDGTLVESEKLKAQSYAIAVQRMRVLPEPENRAIEAYRDIVGASRQVASRHVMDSLNLESELQPLVAEYGVTEAWEVLSSMRKEIYDDMVADPTVLQDNRWPHTIGLLRVARETACRTALATMSYRDEALHVLKALELEQYLDEVLTREYVAKAKHDPEIYLLAAHKLGVEPQDCLVLEDSPNGVRAGVAAGMNVIAVATPFTVAGLHSSEVLEHAWVVHEGDNLLDVVKERIANHNRSAH